MYDDDTDFIVRLPIDMIVVDIDDTENYDEEETEEKVEREVFENNFN